jgi:hypothetical protein
VKSMKTRIAAGAMIVGLGGLVGLAASADRQKPAQPVAAKPLVRTQVIRRTTRVTKHAKPKIPVSDASTPVASYASTPAYAPVTTASSGATAAPVTTAASGAGGGGREYESEAVEREGGNESEGADD